MSTWRLILRSLFYYRRTHLWILLGAAVSTAIIIGALLVGDSLQYSLHQQALDRLGKTKFALIGSDRFFRDALACQLHPTLNAPAASLLQLPAIVSNSDSTIRVNQAQILGIDEHFWDLADNETAPPHLKPDEILVNRQLAGRLGAGPGDELIIRISNPSLISRDMPLSTDSDLSFATRLKIKQILNDSQLGRFSLQANHIAPYTVFVSMKWLQEKTNLAGRANLLLIGDNLTGTLALETVQNAMKQQWQLEDAALELRELPERAALELRCDRIFIDPAIEQIADSIPGKTQDILTYFVNEMRTNDHATPYSMATATNAGPVPPDMADDEIIINEWLAADLGVQPGDMIEMKYYVLGNMRKLEERTSRFRIRRIVPMEGAAADPQLMPDFPGITDSADCSDWQSGIPIDLDRIRPQDEEYWDDYRGTPKAFITISAGQAIWSNRFGNLTAIRFTPTDKSGHTIRSYIQKHLDPAALGLYFLPVREAALAAGQEALDFGQLFIGFSFFLIIAALLLVGLLFRLALEQRSQQVGTLLALGWTPNQVKRLFLLEGGLLIIAGAILGIAGGIAYTKIMIYALSTIWQHAVSAATIYFHAQTSTICIGALSGSLVGIIAIWLVLRKQGSVPARELLANLSTAVYLPTSGRRRITLWLTIVSMIAVMILLTLSVMSGPKHAAAVFFTAGTTLLIATLSASRVFLQQLSRISARLRMTVFNLGLRNMSRKMNRNMTIIALLACGSFLVIAIGANRHDPLQNALLRNSGTGGFSLFAQSTLPIYRDLNSTDTQKFYGLDPDEMKQVHVIPFRRLAGDDASCLNLNRPQHPPLLACFPQTIQSVNPFSFAQLEDENFRVNPWLILEKDYGENVIPAIADYDTILWALGKAIGETISYTDERGQIFQIRLVGAIQKTMLQGSLIISENNFHSRYPSAAGYRMFLIDTPAESAHQVSQSLSRSLRDFGLEVTPAPERLALFLSVENTYLSIFLLLGGLGLVLGSIGLGLVVMRNVLERRQELALLRAVGFQTHTLHHLILTEHYSLLLLGLAAGTVSALLALTPNLRSATADLPLGSLVITLLLLAANGLVWIWLATRLALRGSLLPALRRE